MRSGEEPKLARTSTAAAVPIAVEAAGPGEQHIVPSVAAVPALKHLSEAASASNAITQMIPSATMRSAKRGGTKAAPQSFPTTQHEYTDAANKTPAALEASLSEHKLR